MERFELQDIFAQDKSGIVYSAWDSVLGRKVSIRRFFPFGQSGGGLEKEEAMAFASASNRLSELQHESLRAILSGGVDPIDSIPYLVTEWVEGESLGTLLAEQPMEPALVIDVLRIALEMSIILSHVLGEEAVWVETDTASIVVGSQESGRGFTFWISPFKWLGADLESRKLSAIVTLGEELTGWKKKLVSDQAGYGLGGWMKWLRSNPDASLHEALESLSASTGKEPPEPKQAIVQQANRPVIRKFKQKSTKAPLLIAATLALVVTGVAFLYFHKMEKAPDIAAEYSEQTTSEVIVNTTPGKKAKPAGKAPKANDTALARVNARAAQMRQDAEATTKKESKEAAKSNERIEAQRDVAESRGGILSPEQSELAKSFKNGARVTLQGIIRSIDTSDSGKSIYLNFPKSSDTAIVNGIAHQRDFKGDYKPEAFKGLIGKNTTIKGIIFIQYPQKIYYVKITSMDQITTEE